MNVFVVQYHNPYEADTLEDIFSTKEKAVAYVEAHGGVFDSENIWNYGSQLQYMTITEWSPK
jgi:hypothetical protein